MAQIGTFDVDNSKRRLITPTNLSELGITPDLIASILSSKPSSLQRYQVNENNSFVTDSKGQRISLWPDGISINETDFGTFSGPSASRRGWMAYFEIGVPLVEERADVIQPRADVLSTRTYENRSRTERQFSDTISFTIGNTITWSLTGTGEVTFEGTIGGELSDQLSRTVLSSLSNSTTLSDTATAILHAHKDEMGTEFQNALEASNTSTALGSESCTETGTATGSGSLSAELMLGISGSISGTLTTSWESSSTTSGTIPTNTRVGTMATQRRQVKQYTYELPITFGGFVALHYPALVQTFNEANTPQPNTESPTQVVAREINNLGFVGKNQSYRAKGIAETTSTLDVNHVVFENQSIQVDNSQTLGTNRPHNF